MSPALELGVPDSLLSEQAQGVASCVIHPRLKNSSYVMQIPPSTGITTPFTYAPAREDR